MKDPFSIMKTAFGFWESKVLLTAVEMDLFTLLGPCSMTAEQIERKLSLHPRGTYDFLDALVSMGFLDREGDGPGGLYKNTETTRYFLDKNGDSYVGGILEMLNARLFKYWDDLGDALKTGQPQNEIKHSQKPMFEELYADIPRLEQFMGAMTGLSRQNFVALAQKFDFSKYRTLCDVGGAAGVLSIAVAEKHRNLVCTSFDLPAVEPIAKRSIERTGMSDRIKTASGDFFSDPLPKADVITMGMILHDWNLEKKKH
ncbi:MAG TPA: methyltransferase, partial [Thermodesulfobacteriota bacterium]|nr:methyltransferase [Thermodesulfobacteriota bacterium]